MVEIMYMVQINIIRMFRQLEYFEEYQKRVASLIGAERTTQLVNGALVLITVGGNDFVNNYYLVPFSARSRQYALPDYVKLLIVEYRKLLLVISLTLISYSTTKIDKLDKLFNKAVIMWMLL